MVIQELKPSRRVEGRWLAVLEDGSILRLGEGEVVRFALYAGKELTDREALDIQDCARRSELKEKALALLTRKPQSRRELGRKLREWEASDQGSTAGGCPGPCGRTPWTSWRGRRRPSTPSWPRSCPAPRTTPGPSRGLPTPWPAGASPGPISGRACAGLERRWRTRGGRPGSGSSPDGPPPRRQLLPASSWPRSRRPDTAGQT